VKDGALFSSTLGDALAALVGKHAATSATTPASDDALLANLAKQIRDQLDRGTSLDAIVQQLAGSLATQVAAQLGVSTQAAHERLTHAFTAALSSTGQGPPGTTNAERASALATRFGQLAMLAARVTNGEAGPSIRSIAGTSLDADTAGADPTPKTTSDGSAPQTQDASAVAASPLTPNPLAGPTDGRTVAIASTEAIATGGDTLLGRMVARAYLAGDRSAPTPSAPARTVGPASASGTTTTGVTAAGAHNAVDAFVRAFGAALAHDDASHTPSDTGTPATASVAPATPGSNDQPSVPFAIAFAHGNAATATTTPGSTPAQTAAADPHAIVEQVVRAMAIQTAGDGTSTIRLRLVPEHLGDVSVKLVVSGGSVDATLTAHTADAQSVLAGGQAQLAKTLADAGLKLQSFSVGLTGGGFAQTGDRSNQQRETAPSSVRRIGGVATDEADAPSDDDLLAVPSFGPPIYTPSGSLGAFNYLV
jgi:flagellar hook-length control protein FliK